MKINNEIFSFPPHISTTWTNIVALHMKGKVLVIALRDGETVHIPDLTPGTLELIFKEHASYLEEKAKRETSKTSGMNAFSLKQLQGEIGDLEFPFRLGIGSIEGWGAALQHNPAQAETPDLPEEVLQKIQAIAKIVAPDDPVTAPKPEPHCNCIHCQIARAINQGLGHTDIYQKEETDIEDVSEKDLQFQQWDIKQSETDKRLYEVTNRLDIEERYNVYLGHPLGCTCGRQGCEHILAVLKS